MNEEILLLRPPEPIGFSDEKRVPPRIMVHFLESLVIEARESDPDISRAINDGLDHVFLIMDRAYRQTRPSEELPCIREVAEADQTLTTLFHSYIIVRSEKHSRLRGNDRRE